MSSSVRMTAFDLVKQMPAPAYSSVFWWNNNGTCFCAFKTCFSLQCSQMNSFAMFPNVAICSCANHVHSNPVNSLAVCPVVMLTALAVVYSRSAQPALQPSELVSSVSCCGVHIICCCAFGACCCLACTSQVDRRAVSHGVLLRACALVH